MSRSESVLDLFKGRHFDREVIVLCVRWYLSYKLSSRDLVEMMSERGIALTLDDFCAGSNGTCRFLKNTGVSTHDRWAGPDAVTRSNIKVKGRWAYLYRAVDRQGRTVDFLLSERRDVAAAKDFFRKAMKHRGTPRVITLDA
jgi:transposase-like protein